MTGGDLSRGRFYGEPSVSSWGELFDFFFFGDEDYFGQFFGFCFFSYGVRHCVCQEELYLVQRAIFQVFAVLIETCHAIYGRRVGSR